MNKCLSSRRMRYYIPLVLLCTGNLVNVADAALAPDHVGVAAGASTLGTQLLVDGMWGRYVGLTGGVAVLNGISARATISNVKFTAKARFLSQQITANLHPFAKVPLLRYLSLDGGVVFNQNRFSADPRLQGHDFTYQGYVFEVPKHAQFTTKLKFNPVNPYAGISLGATGNSGFGLNLALGAIYQGAPQVGFAVSGVKIKHASKSQVDAAIAHVEADITKQIKRGSGWLSWYPVASLQLAYNF